MKIKYLLTSIVGILFFLSLLLSSCDNNVIVYDMPKDQNEQKILDENFSGLDPTKPVPVFFGWKDKKQNFQYSIVDDRTPEDVVAKMEIVFSKEFSADQVKYSVVPNENLLAIYNLENKASYKLLPSEAYKLEFAGSIKSSENLNHFISVDLQNLSNLAPEGSYLLPLEIKLETKDEGFVVSKEVNVTYLVVDVVKVRCGLSWSKTRTVLDYNISNMADLKSVVEIDLRLTREFPKTIKYNVVANNSLIEKFNNPNQLAYKVLPENSFKLTYDGEFAVAQKEQKVTVNIMNLVDLNLSQGIYLLPLEIKLETQDEYLYVEDYVDVTYLFIDVNERFELKFHANIDSYQLLDRTDWSVLDPYGDKIDGFTDNNESIVWKESPNEENFFIIDFGKQTSLGGLVFETSTHADYGYYYSEYLIYASDDKDNWDLQGRYVLKENASFDGTRYAVTQFREKINVRYIKCVPMRCFTYVGFISELYAFSF